MIAKNLGDEYGVQSFNHISCTSAPVFVRETEKMPDIGLFFRLSPALTARRTIDIVGLVVSGDFQRLLSMSTRWL
tara:strand:+ start:2932 stop:3156 length:225 start_codon:yes stop_codon:yes gene_type:complete